MSLLFIFLLSVACSENGKDAVGQGVSCISDFAATPCALIDKAKLAELAGTTESDVVVEAPDIEPGEKANKYKQVYCTYSWPSNRNSIMSITVGEKQVNTEMELKNVIISGNIEVIQEDDLLDFKDETYADYYQRNYGVNHEDTQKEVNGIGENAVAKVISLANHSNWQKTSLSVLHKNVIFIVEVDVSDEDNTDLELAKKIALEILANCN